MFEGDANWKALHVPTGDLYAWDASPRTSPTRRTSSGMAVAPPPVPEITGRGCWPCSATASPPTTSRPAGNIKKDSPAGKYLIEHGVEPKDFNQYGARRGHHEVMMRGTFANVRLKNLLVPGVEGGVTRHLPTGQEMSIYDAAMEYQKEGDAAGDPGRQGVRLRVSSRDWAAKGTQPARRAGGDRRELRAHPPQQPGRHGRAAAAVQAGRDGRRRSG